ncbi:DUF3822 family protein, partial [Salmonella enterica]|uniref:DUF3822 family protein n=1 Tax=Salmonella enterica TaxID=28901 RepID=UPI003D281DF6
MNAYRIKRSLFDIVRSNFMMVETKHYYSKVLENLLKNNQLGQGIFLRLEFYHNFFLLVLINHNQLQLIQQYAYSSADD